MAGAPDPHRLVHEPLGLQWKLWLHKDRRPGCRATFEVYRLLNDLGIRREAWKWAQENKTAFSSAIEEPIKITFSFVLRIAKHIGGCT